MVKKCFGFLSTAAVVACLTVVSASAQHAPDGPDKQSPETQPVDVNAPRFEFSPKIFDFGEVWEGAPAKQEFAVRNVGVKPLTVSVTTSCGCTPATQPKSPLAPGESSTFTLQYKTTTIGPTHKRATVTTNDPLHPKTVIPVRGIVKPVFALSPSRRMMFRGLELNSTEAQTMKLKNEYKQPVTLKLKDGQDFGNYDVELKAIDPGQEYELRVATRPPLRQGVNAGKVILETSLKELPTLTIRLYGTAAPRVYVQPNTLYVLPRVKQPMETPVDVVFNRRNPVQVTDVTCELPGFAWARGEAPARRPGSLTDVQRLILTVPAYDEIPVDGGLIKILTDDESGRYSVVDLRVVRRVPRPRSPTPRTSTRPAAREPARLDAD